MRVLFDYQAFQIQKIGGVSRGFAEVLSRLERYGIDWEIAVRDSANANLAELLPHIPLSGKFETRSTFHAKHPRVRGWEQLYRFLIHLRLARDSDGVNKQTAAKKIIEGNYDVFHPTFFDSYFLRYVNNLRKKPLVVTIHDMTPERFPHLCSTKDIAAKEILTRYATHIVVPSQNTKNDVADILHYPETRIKVIPWGADTLSEAYLDALPRIVTQPYLLFVGARWTYKGFDVLLSEFKKIRQQHPELILVCTGTPFHSGERQTIARLGLTESVVQRYVSQQELHSLYKYAKAFVFPSLYEGFGIPVYEAFSCGCPVFLNDASCFREVGKNGAKYFRQDETSSTFSTLFLDYLKNEETMRQAMTAEGRRIINAASWDKTAQTYADFYKEIV